jgi:hypothetical protein
LAAVEVGNLSPYARRDLGHVGGPSERPTDADYDRYIWLVKLIKSAYCDESAIYRSHPFLMKDVFFSAILVAANKALLEIAQVIGATGSDRELIAGWIRRGREGLEACWDNDLGLCLDYDARTGIPIRVRTVASFAPLISGELSGERLKGLLQTLDSPAFSGNPKLRWPLPPSTGASEPDFDSRNYWRGPVWPVADWLLWWSLIRAGEPRRAVLIRRASLDQISQGGFAEYFEPFSGEPLGSTEQSWTAAIALDWLKTDEPQLASFEAA